jgi:hypothetical protein
VGLTLTVAAVDGVGRGADAATCRPTRRRRAALGSAIAMVGRRWAVVLSKYGRGTK